MKKFILAAAAFLFLALGHHAAYAGCPVPNPNLLAPPFVDGCPLPAVALNNAYAVQGTFSPFAYGATGNGVTDDTAGLQACLNAAGAITNGACYVGKGRFYTASGITIPAHTTLWCGYTRPGASGAAWNTLPGAILFNMSLGTAVAASGQGAAINGCAFLPYGVTYPIGSYSGNFGTSTVVLDDMGHADFHVTHSAITGGNAAIHLTGARPFVDDVIADGLGQTEGVIRWDVGNTDSGDVRALELADGFWSTGSIPLCLPGTGFFVGGSPVGAAALFMYGRIVSEGYNTADYHFANSAIADSLWADDFSATCGFNTSYNYIVDTGVFLQANVMTSAAAETGVLENGYLSTGQLFIESVGGDAVQMAGAHGTMKVHDFVVAGAGQYAMEFDSNTQLIALTNVSFSGSIHGGSVPYIQNLSGNDMVIGNWSQGANLWIGNIDTGTTVGTNIFSTGAGDTFLLTSGSQGATNGLAPTIACTNMGSGSCAFNRTGDDIYSGQIFLMPAGSPGSSTTVSITSPLGALHTTSCNAAVGNNTGAWTAPISILSSGSAVVAANGSGTNFTAGETYLLNYTCVPF